MLKSPDKIGHMQEKEEAIRDAWYHKETGTKHIETTSEYPIETVDYATLRPKIQEHQLSLGDERRIIFMGSGVTFSRSDGDDKKFNVYVNIEHSSDCQISYCILTFHKGKWADKDASQGATI